MQDLKDQYYMSLALQEAKKARDIEEVPVGALIVKDDQVIGSGYNLVETSKMATKHAEMIALEEAMEKLGAWRLTGATLYVTLEPCAMCAGAIVHARLDRVVIGTQDPKRGCGGTVINLLDFPYFNHRCQVDRGVLQDQCSQILSEFFQALRKK